MEVKDNSSAKCTLTITTAKDLSALRYQLKLISIFTKTCTDRAHALRVLRYQFNRISIFMSMTNFFWIRHVFIQNIAQYSPPRKLSFALIVARPTKVLAQNHLSCRSLLIWNHNITPTGWRSLDPAPSFPPLYLSRQQDFSAQSKNELFFIVHMFCRHKDPK